MNQKESWIQSQKQMNSRERTHQEYVPENYNTRERTTAGNQPNKVNPKEREHVEYVPPTYQHRDHSREAKTDNPGKNINREGNDLSKMREMMEGASKKQESRTGGN